MTKVIAREEEGKRKEGGSEEGEERLGGTGRDRDRERERKGEREKLRERDKGASKNKSEIPISFIYKSHNLYLF